MLYFISFLWGFAESSVFFIIPDVILTYIAFFYGFKKGFKAVIFTLIGALLGGSLIYFLAKYHILNYHFFEKIPYINEKMILHTKTLIDESIFNIVYAPLNGIPYKLFAYWFGFENINFLLFLVYSTFARVWRFALVVLIAGAIGYFVKNHKVKYKKLWQIIFLIVWVVIYGVYFYKIESIYY